MVLALSNHPCEACVQAQQAHQARFSREVRADRIFRTVGRPCYQTGRFPTTRNVNTVGPYRPQKLLRLVPEVFPCIPDSQKLFSVPNLSQRPIFWFSGFAYPKNRHVISSLVIFTLRCAAHLTFKSFTIDPLVFGGYNRAEKISLRLHACPRGLLYALQCHQNLSCGHDEVVDQFSCRDCSYQTRVDQWRNF